MLHGTLTYRDEHLGDVQYSVYANDNFDGIKFYFGDNSGGGMYTNYVNSQFLFDKQIKYLYDVHGNRLDDEEYKQVVDSMEAMSSARLLESGAGYMYDAYETIQTPETRRLDIKTANKYKTNITNSDFCLRISSIVRYMQINGKKNYNQNLTFVSEEDHFQTERIVHVDDLGYIRYDMGLIKEFKLDSKYVSFHLTEVPDDIFDIGIFKELKQKDSYGNVLSTTPIVTIGFKFHAESLGFDYEPPMAKEPVNLFGVYETIEEVIEANPEKNTSWIMDRKYIIVTDDILESVLKEFMDYDGYIAFDTETTGLNVNFKSRIGEGAQLVGVVLSKEKGTGYYFPLQHKLFQNLCGGDHWYFMEKYMKVMLESKKIIGHNIKFDWKVAYIYDIVVNFVYDTLLALGVTKRYEEESYLLGLKAVISNLFGLDMFDLSDFVATANFSDSGITFADLPYELVRRYAPSDGDMTLTLFEFIEREAFLSKYEAEKIFEIEVNFAKAVAYAEFYGYHVDVPKIPAMRDEIHANMEKYKQQMFKIAGREFNPDSSPQLTKIMYEELGIEVIGDKPSTKKEILGTLMDRTNEDGSPKYPFVVALKKYRDNSGINKNFLKRLAEFSTPDGYIFSDTKQLGTDTGRTSAGDPNYQSYNDAVKKYIVPRPGYIHFDCDFSQIEYRVLASLAQQESLMAEFEDADLDYHTFQASRMFGIAYASVTKALRNQSKGVNFGLPYGMGDSSLGARIFGERNKVNQAKAAVLRRKFFQGQEKIEEFFERTRSEGVAKGYTSTHWGRRRYYHRTKFTTAEIRRQAGNHVIQGTAADIYKIAVCRMFNRIVDEGWLGKVLINVFVHDELLMEVHKSINMFYFFKAWREEFELDIEGFCKLYAGAGVGKSWVAAKKQDLPPQYISEIIAQYHEDMPWDEDLDAFTDKIVKGYEDYKIRRVKDYIVAEENQGEVIKPLINSLMVEKTESALKEIKLSENSSELICKFNVLLGADLIKDDKNTEKMTKDWTFENFLVFFGEQYGVDHRNVRVLSPDSTAAPSQIDTAENKLNFSDDDYSLADLIELRGYYLDETGDVDTLYIMDKNMTYNGLPTTVLNYIGSKNFLKTQGAIKIGLYDQSSKGIVVYDAFISEEDYRSLVLLYNTLAGVAFRF